MNWYLNFMASRVGVAYLELSAQGVYVQNLSQVIKRLWAAGCQATNCAERYRVFGNSDVMETRVLLCLHSKLKGNPNTTDLSPAAQEQLIRTCIRSIIQCLEQEPWQQPNDTEKLRRWATDILGLGASE